MKKTLSSIIMLSLLLVGIVPASAHAASDGRTLITGYVTEKGKGVEGATVVASCGRYFAATDVTDATGAYLTTLPIVECGWGSDVELLAVTDTNFGTARGYTIRITSKLNIANTPILLP
jgi:hypothetical protein